MIALVCGGREFDDRDCVFGFLSTFHAKQPIDLLVCGGAKGADRLAAEWALDVNVDLRTQNARWNDYGKSAGVKRNYGMLMWVLQNKVYYSGEAVCIAFPGGVGTDNMIQQATGKLEIFRPSPELHQWYRNHELVVNIKDEDYDVYCGRPSKWGNPFAIGKDGSRSEVIEKYRTLLNRRLELRPEYRDEIKRELRGKRLGCYCNPLPCHVTLLAEIANEDIQT